MHTLYKDEQSLLLAKFAVALHAVHTVPYFLLWQVGGYEHEPHYWTVPVILVQSFLQIFILGTYGQCTVLMNLK
jgi:hypothetical protein